jgi:hypothetical protein
MMKMPEQQVIPELPVFTDRPMIVQTPKGEGFMKKLGMGLLCSCLVAVAMNFLRLKAFVIYVCAALLAVLGWKVEKPAGEVSPSFIDRGQAVISKVVKPEGELTILKDAPKSKTATKKAGGLLGKAKQKAKEKVGEAVAAPVKAVTDGVKDKATQVVAKVDDAKDKVVHEAKDLKAALTKKSSQIASGRAEARIEAKEEYDRRHEDWVKHGPNGMCPYCRYPMRVTTRGLGPAQCPNGKCQMISDQPQIRAMGRPEMPRNFQGFNR